MHIGANAEIGGGWPAFGQNNVTVRISLVAVTRDEPATYVFASQPWTRSVRTARRKASTPASEATLTQKMSSGSR